jgi:hypothetical protein
MLRPRDPLAFVVAFAVMTLRRLQRVSCPPGAQREPNRIQALRAE